MDEKEREQVYGPAWIRALAGVAARASGKFDTESVTGDPMDGFYDGFGEAAFRAGYWAGWQDCTDQDK